MRTRFLSIPLLLAALAALAAGAAGAQARWPSLQEQLHLDRAPAGSALARLIGANQDFQLLRPEEAHDQIGVPAWLRVYWRKQHPELEYSAADPTGGYPLLLKDIHQWVVDHPDLRPREAPPDVLPKELKGSSAGDDLPMGLPQSGSRAESDIRVNYWNTSQVLASTNNLGFTGLMSMYYSQDGGATWGQTSLPRIGGDDFQSDPAVEWTSDGTAWATAIGVAPGFTALKLRAWKSTDGGATWMEDGIISGSQTVADKQMVWTDHSGRSRFKDNLYAIWHNGRPVFMGRRNGAAGGWSDPLQVSGGETFGTGIGSDVKTNSSGHVFGLWPDTGSRRIFAVRSLDGGGSYGKPTLVASTFGSFGIRIPAQNLRAVLIYVTAGAFQNGKKSNVYAAWTDLTGATSCRTPGNQPGSNVSSPCKTRIWFARSTNGGQRFTPAKMINNPSTLNDQFNPWMVVDEATGALGIIYYDTAGEDRTRVNVWYQSSYDGGVKWTAPLKVTSAPSDASGATSTAFQFGDYNGFSGIAGTFFPAWSDQRGLRQESWTAKITETKGRKCKTTDLFADGFGAGSANVSVAAGAAETRLAFWHRRRFTSGENGGALKVSVDGGPALAVPAAAILEGAGYGAGGEPLFKGVDRRHVQTVVDLDAVCDAATGGAGGCGGRSLRLSFATGDLPAGSADGWVVEEAAVTACTR